MKQANIYDIVLAITYNCNSRCRMCNIWKNNENLNFNPELMNNLPSNLKYLNISGGEPFLHPELKEIVAKAKIIFPEVKIIISSNGFATGLIIAKMVELLKIDNDIGVAISLDGIGQKHDETRGIEGGFEKVMETVKKLKKLEKLKNIKLAFTLGDYNFDELKKVYNLSKELNVGFTISLVHSSENYFGQNNKIEKKEDLINELDWLTNQELKTWSPKKWARAYYIHGLVYLIKNNKRILPDYSGEKNIFIDPTGKIYPNDVANYEIGNLNNSNNKYNKINKKDLPVSWMICTARAAIKKHWLKVIGWIFINKTLSIFSFSK